MNVDTGSLSAQILVSEHQGIPVFTFENFMLERIPEYLFAPGSKNNKPVEASAYRPGYSTMLWDDDVTALRAYCKTVRRVEQ